MENYHNEAKGTPFQYEGPYPRSIPPMQGFAQPAPMYYPPPAMNVQPPPLHYPLPIGPYNALPPLGSSSWQSHLCGCCENCGVCCLTCWLPCVTFGQISEILDKGQGSCCMNGVIYGLLTLVCCQSLFSCTYRSKLRATFGLREEPCNDCCLHFCCEPCALCQEHRELSKRGFDPSIGWGAHAQRVMASPQQPFMNR